MSKQSIKNLNALIKLANTLEEDGDIDKIDARDIRATAKARIQIINS